MEKKKILGTWFEFQHHNLEEGKYWNNDLLNFTDMMWRNKVNEIADLGMEFIVLLATSLYDEAYFDTTIYPKSSHICQELIKVLLDQADKRNLKVFLSAGYYGNWMDPFTNMINEEVTKRAFQAIKELNRLYGSYQSFYGWYLPDETGANPYFDDIFISYVNKYSDYFHQLDPNKKVLIAPYGTRLIKTDRIFKKQLNSLKVDFIAYQDEVGVKKSSTSEIAEFYKNLRDAHDKAKGPAIWADIELFEFEGETYQSPLLPACFSRVEKQIEAVSPYVDVILSYQYIGLMNPNNSLAKAGDSVKSQKLYHDYKEWLQHHKLLNK